MILSDTHTHTHFSTDSKANGADMLARATEQGLAYLCFTDHMDLDFPGDDSLFVFDPNEYFREYAPLQESSLSGNTKLLIGIEMGLRPGRYDLQRKMDELLYSRPYDYVIGSTHIVDEMDPYEAVYWEPSGDRLRRYFETVYQNTFEHTNFDALGHLDYIIRYMPKTYSSVMDYQVSDYQNLLEETLKLIARRGQALEINTAGLRKGLSFPHPKPELLRMFREFGGEYVTLGSDAHAADQVGSNLKEAAELLLSCGFSYYTVFQKRKPVPMHL